MSISVHSLRARTRADQDGSRGDRAGRGAPAAQAGRATSASDASAAVAASAASEAPVARAVVVIPALEPGQDLVRLVAELAADGIDVVVVDDGSGPRFQVVFDRCAVIGATVIHLAENHGKGYALREAFALVEREFAGAGVVTADADGQHTPADIRAVRDMLDGRGAEGEDLGEHGNGGERGVDAADASAPLVLGVRSFGGGDVPLRSRLGNAVSALLFRAAAGVAIGDTQTGLRGIASRHLPWARNLPGDRYEYEYTMLVRAAREGIGLITLPISTVYVDENATSHFRPLRDSVRVLTPVLAFAGSSLSSSALDTVVFLLAAALGAPIWAALTIARILSSTMNFSVNRWVVFRGGKQPGLLRSALRYAGLAVGILAAGVLLVDVLAALGMPLVVSKVLADLSLFVVSFAVQRLVVFAKR